MQDPVDPVLTEQLSGWVFGQDWKWTAWEHALYFVIGFSIAAVTVMATVSWTMPAMPSAPDFISPSTNIRPQDEETADDEQGPESIAAFSQDNKLSTSSSARVAYLQFQNLSYWVTLPSGEVKQLLDNVFGYARPGRLVALIGKSGAGKSTLLDVLAGKKTGGRLEGTILVNGQPKNQAAFSGYAGYVEQFDSFSPLNTVRETVLFSGRLRLSPELTQEELNRKVDHVLDTLGMRPSENAIVGFPGMGGISLELRKKLTIAVEVIAEPALLFLDGTIRTQESVNT
jgi:ABC-type glutathione transport system ATPase component